MSTWYLDCGHHWTAEPGPARGDLVLCRRCDSYQYVRHNERELAREHFGTYTGFIAVRNRLAAELGRIPTMSDLLANATASTVATDEVKLGRAGVDWTQSPYAAHLTESHQQDVWRVFDFPKGGLDDKGAKEIKLAVINTAKALDLGYRFRDIAQADGGRRIMFRGAPKKSYELSPEGRASRAEGRAKAAAARATEKQAAANKAAKSK